MKFLTYIANQFSRLAWWRRHSSSEAFDSSNASVITNLRAFIAETTAPLVLAAREKGIDMVVNVRDTVPDQFEGSEEGVKRTIIRQVESALETFDTGYVRFDVSWNSGSDGRSKLRFRTSTSRKHKPDLGFMKPNRRNMT